MKRCLDLLLAFLLLVVLSPLLLVLAIILPLLQGRPLLFSQKRPGKDGIPFQLYKFRTMNPMEQSDKQPGDLWSDPDRLRITPIGRFLRTSSLDELPSLWNVLKGEMSLVGPRPLLMEYLPLYSEKQARRHEVRPGITGWAQVRGRNTLSWQEQFEMDVWYVDNQTFLLDLKIILLTIGRVFRRSGIEDGSKYTRKPFTGE